MPPHFRAAVTLQHGKRASYFKICFTSNFFFSQRLNLGLCASLVSMPINVIKTKDMRRMRPLVPDSESMVVQGSKPKVTILHTKNE